MKTRSSARRLSFAALCGLLALSACAGDQTAETPPQAMLDRNALVRLADKLQTQGDTAMAAAFYERAIAEDPQNAAAYYGLAKLRNGMGNTAEAERAYREALRHDNRNPDILRDYAKLLLTQGNNPSAATQYRALLALHSEDGRALNGLGVALDQMGQHAEAQTQYRAALALNADDMAATNNLGLSLIMSGHAAGAVAVLAPAAESFKGTENIRQNLALAMAKAREQQAAPPAPPAPAAPTPLSSLSLPPLAPLPAASSESRKEVLMAVAEPVAPSAAAIQAQPAPATYQRWKKRAAMPVLPALEQRTVIGPYATDAIAQAQMTRLQDALGKEMPAKALLNIVTGLTSAGTPEFAIHLYGFADQAAIDAFCARALRLGVPCRQG